jgi:hypothetical protein
VSRRKRIWISLLAVIGVAGLSAAYAPSIIGPLMADYINHKELDESLAACKPDELIYAVFYGQRASESATFNFTTQKLTGGDAEGGAPTGPWFGPSKSVYYNVSLGYNVTYSDEQVRQIKGALASLPVPASPSLTGSSYRNQIHLAFYQGNHLLIYHYPKLLAPPQLADLCAALKIPEHAQ